jgi:hypothetical protein
MPRLVPGIGDVSGLLLKEFVAVKDAKGKLQTATTTYWSAHRVGSG